MFKKLLGKFIKENTSLPASFVPLYVMKEEGFAFPFSLADSEDNCLSPHVWNSFMRKIMFHTGLIAGFLAGMIFIASGKMMTMPAAWRFSLFLHSAI